MGSSVPAGRSSLGELARLFLRLGLTSFGGPAAHVAMMEDEVVRRRGWLSRDDFLDYVGATQLIPGPNSTELAIHLGHLRGGWPGLLTAGAAFILPATLLVGGAAWAYVRWGALPEVAGVLYGVAPVVIAVVLQALVGLARSAAKSGFLVALGLTAVGAAAAGVDPLVVLAAAGALAALASIRSGPRRMALAIPLGALPATGAAAAPFGLLPLFAVFLKVGAVLYGSGYVLLAFLRADLVERLGWLTEQQLLDAVAVGQVTPGPVFTTATFVGYLLGGSAGAVVATVGIFLPSFVFVALSARLVPRIRRSPLAGAALDGVNVASLALMALVTWQLGRAALTDAVTLLLALASAVALIRFRVSSTWLILAGAASGALAQAFGGR